ncbi:MAG: nitroreductase family protein [Spirochaetaceae bacterium]|nr:nitroreductase family protein [Spirochaetaceae bacterium]
MNEAYNNIITRRSIRNFTGEIVSKEIIDLILEAGLAAPSAVNKQPWEILVVEDREILDTIANLEGFYTKMTKKASAAIVVCGNTEKTLPGLAQIYWVQDTSAMTENILLASHALGIGAVWTGVYPSVDRVKKVSELLDLPSHIIPLNIIPIGVISNENTFAKEIDKSCIHYGKWTK